MSVTMVRQKVKDGSVKEAEAAVRNLFTTLARVHPGGVRYASTRLADTTTRSSNRPAVGGYVCSLDHCEVMVRQATRRNAAAIRARRVD